MTSTASPLLPNNGRVIQNGAVRILCIADVRGLFGPNTKEIMTNTDVQQAI